MGCKTLKQIPALTVPNNPSKLCKYQAQTHIVRDSRTRIATRGTAPLRLATPILPRPPSYYRNIKSRRHIMVANILAVVAGVVVGQILISKTSIGDTLKEYGTAFKESGYEVAAMKSLKKKK